MMILDVVEFAFQFPNLSAVSVHLLAGARLVLVNLVDDQGGFVENHEAFYAKFNGDTKAMKACFIFGGIVGG